MFPLFIFCALGIFTACGPESPPRAAAGVLDLRDWSLRRDGPAALDGEWEFTPGRAGADSHSRASVPYASVPGTWNDLLGTGRGAATYRLRIQGLESGKNAGSARVPRLALRLPDMGTSFEARIDGKPVARAGNPDARPGAPEPSYARPVIQFDPSGDSLVLSILVANETHFRGGFWDHASLGTPEDILVGKERSLAFELLLAGGLLIIGLYHLGLFSVRRGERSALYFGLVCLCIAARTLLTGERFLVNVTSLLNWPQYVRLEYAVTYACIPLFLAYIRRVYPEEARSGLLPILYAAVALLLAAVLFLPSYYYTATLLPFEIVLGSACAFVIYVLLRAVKNERDGPVVALLGFAVLALCALNDILTEARVISSGLILPAGVFVFVLCQAYLLALQYSRAFEARESLTERLRELKSALEVKVAERTLDLEGARRRAEEEARRAEEKTRAVDRARSKIEQLNLFSKRINASVSPESLNEILEQIFEYIESNFGIDASFIQFYEPKKNRLVFHRASRSAHLNEEQRDFLKKLVVPMDERGGFVYKTLLRKRPFYLPRTDMEIKNEYDRRVVRTLGVNSFLYVPLVVRDEVIAMISFTSFRSQMRLSKSDIRDITGFCEQAAGAIYASNLLDYLAREKENSERLLLNILPEEVAQELKRTGHAEPVLFDSVTVMFTDFKGFTQVSEHMTPRELVGELDRCFSYYDLVMDRYNLEKLKTIGDSYMCAGGIPLPNSTHAVDAVLAALEIQGFMNQMKEMKRMKDLPYWELRLGIHTGPLVAGVIGEKKFAYDVWGDTVNTASRMESSGAPGRVNISRATYEMVSDFFECEYRGKVLAKNKGEIDMYFVHAIRPELSRGSDGRVPNERFEELRAKMSAST